MPKTTSALKRKSSSSATQLALTLTRDDIKKCFKTEKKDKTQKQCVFCGKTYKTNGNTSNEKAHLLAKHSDVLVEHLKNKPAVVVDIDDADEDNSEHTLTSKLTQDGASDGPAFDSNPVEKQPQKVRKINDFFDQPRASGEQSKSQDLVFMKQLSLEEAFKRAQQVPTCSSSLANNMVQFLCRIGVPLSHFNTIEDFECFTHSAFSGLKFMTALASFDDKVALLKTAAVAKINSAETWSCDLQVLPISAEKSVGASIVYFLDDHVGKLVGVVLHTCVDRTERFANFPEEVGVELREAVVDLGLQWQRLTAVMNHTETSAKVMATVMPLGAREFDCVITTLDKYHCQMFNLESTKSLKQKVRSIARAVKFHKEDFLAEAKKTKSEVAAIKFIEAETIEELLVRLNDCAKTVSAFLCNSLISKDQPLFSFQDFVAAKEIHLISHSMKAAMKKIDVSPQFLVSQTVPFIVMTMEKLKRLSLHTAVGLEAKAFVVGKLQNWKTHRGDSEPYVTSQALDPRYKVSCIGDSENPLISINATTSIKSRLKSFVKEEEEKQLSQRMVPADDQSNHSTEDEDQDLMGVDDDFNFRAFTNKVSSSSRKNAVSAEEKELLFFNNYVKDPNLEDDDIDVFRYWRNRKPVEKYLSSFAILSLSVPGKRQTKALKHIHSRNIKDSEFNNMLFCATLPVYMWNM